MKANLPIIESKRQKIGIPRAELARRCEVCPDTLYYFLKRGKQLNKDLALIDRLCRELHIDKSEVIR